MTGTEIIGFYLVAEKELREGKNGMFLRLKVQDRSGALTGYVWKDAPAISEQFSEGDVVKIKAMVQNYKGQIQLNISQIRFADHSEYNIEDYLVRSKIEPEVLAERFFSFVDKVQNPFLNKLLKAAFSDKDFFNAYLNAPAAKAGITTIFMASSNIPSASAPSAIMYHTLYPNVNYDSPDHRCPAARCGKR